MLLIVTSLDSKFFGITFDTGNCLRNGDEPVGSAKLLGDHIFATHLKDVAPMYGGDPKEWYYYACTPVGQGVIDIPSSERSKFPAPIIRYLMFSPFFIAGYYRLIEINYLWTG